ncbi:MAG TPA: DUF2069 domain-containing protein [Thiotrichales bacterium]|nr:DUF2069 domain-containing protein [Thiotrichales bacterium]
MTASRWLALTLAGYLGLFAWLGLWITFLSPPERLPVSLALLLAGTPLLFPLRGLLHGRPYTVKWSLFLALFYFTHGVVEAYASAGERPYALLEVLLALTWFAGGIAYVRKRRADAAGS